MIARRTLIASTLAATAVAAGGAALGQAPEGWVFPEEWLPQLLRINADLPAGQIHVVPQDFNLFLTVGESQAIRYKVGIGRGNLYESGSFYLGAKKEWPTWRPTDEMIERNPAAYEQYAEGMPGGPGNPLGSRALYLFTENRGDTFLRIHGTPEPWTVGSAVSNGCVRLVNSHVEHLYDRVALGAPIILHPKYA